MMQLKSLLSLCSLLVSSTVVATINSIPNHAYSGSSSAEYTAKATDFDGQKVTPYPDGHSYEWWYFDAVSSTTLASVTIVFFETLDTNFLTGIPQYLSLQFAGTHDDGTQFVYAIPADDYSVATVITCQDGASGVWGTTGFSFWGHPEMTLYTVTINSAAYGIYGTFEITSNGSPAHGPCNVRAAGITEVMLPHIGWANAVPDSNAEVNMYINGTALSFNGYGYHDKNWGDIPFTEATSSWYWGHGRLGPYSIVWFDALDWSGNEYVSGYVTKGSTVLEASCTSGAVTVRPYGANSAYPPIAGTNPPTGYDINFNLGSAGTFNVTSVVSGVQILVPNYGRYIGPISGTIGGVNYTGKALYEEFKFAS